MRKWVAQDLIGHRGRNFIEAGGRRDPSLLTPQSGGILELQSDGIHHGIEPPGWWAEDGRQESGDARRQSGLGQAAYIRLLGIKK